MWNFYGNILQHTLVPQVLKHNTGNGTVSPDWVTDWSDWFCIFVCVCLETMNVLAVVLCWYNCFTSRCLYTHFILLHIHTHMSSGQRERERERWKLKVSLSFLSSWLSLADTTTTRNNIDVHVHTHTCIFLQPQAAFSILFARFSLWCCSNRRMRHFVEMAKNYFTYTHTHREKAI